MRPIVGSSYLRVHDVPVISSFLLLEAINPRRHVDDAVAMRSRVLPRLSEARRCVLLDALFIVLKKKIS